VDLSGQWIDCAGKHRNREGIVLDIDSSVSPSHGEQENSVWNGHYSLHLLPSVIGVSINLVISNAARFDLHSDVEWKDVLRPVVGRYKSQYVPIQFRRDTAFALPRMYEFLETQGIEYAIRLPQIRSCKHGSAIC
jgi:hypothetical protein